MNTLADKYLKDTILSSIKVADLAAYAGVDMTVKPKPTKKDIGNLLRQRLTTEEQIHALYAHFERELAIPAPIVCKLLNISTSEYRWMTAEGRLPVVREETCSVSGGQYLFEGCVNKYHDAWHVLHVYPSTLDQWRAEHKVIVHNKRSTAAKAAASVVTATRKANAAVPCPEWVDETVFTWLHTPPTVDQLMVNCATLALGVDVPAAVPSDLVNEESDCYILPNNREGFSFVPPCAAWRGIVLVGKMQVLVSITAERVAYFKICLAERRSDPLYMHKHWVEKRDVQNVILYNMKTKWRTKLPVKGDLQLHMEKRLRTLLADTTRVMNEEHKRWMQSPTAEALREWVVDGAPRYCNYKI